MITFIFILITGLIALIVSYRLSDFMFLTDFLVMISIVDVNINKAIKIDIFVKSLFLIIHSIFYFHDFLFAYTKIEPYYVLTKAFGIRHSLYFSHPNTAAAIVVWLVIDWIYIAKNKRILIALGSLLVAFYSYFTISPPECGSGTAPAGSAASPAGISPVPGSGACAHSHRCASCSR